MRRFRPRLTYANVVATLASLAILVLALPAPCTRAASLDPVPGRPTAVVVTKPAGGGWAADNDFALTITKPPPEVGASPIVWAFVMPCQTEFHLVWCERSEQFAVAADDPTPTIAGVTVPEPGDWTAYVYLGDEAGTWRQDMSNKDAHLLFDPDPPAISVDARDPADPERLSAEVSDTLSGVVQAEIDVALHGTGNWIGLPTVVKGQTAAARIDDGQLPTGQYDERVIAHDAAGNESEVSLPNAVSMPLRVGTLVAANLVSPRPRARKHQPAAIRLVRSLRLKQGRSFMALGSLQTREGHPVPNARIFVTSAPATPGADGHVVGVEQTDDRGDFRFRLWAHQSATLRFSYEGDGVSEPAAATAKLIVPAESTVRVSRHSVFNGDTVVFRGRLRGGGIPSGGKLIILEAWVRGVWQPFDAVRTTRGGRWRAVHTFTTVSHRARFRFRVYVPRDGAYPFAPAVTRQIDIVVSGL